MLPWPCMTLFRRQDFMFITHVNLCLKINGFVFDMFFSSRYFKFHTNSIFALHGIWIVCFLVSLWRMNMSKECSFNRKCRCQLFALSHWCTLSGIFYFLQKALCGTAVLACFIFNVLWFHTFAKWKPSCGWWPKERWWDGGCSVWTWPGVRSVCCDKYTLLVMIAN